MSIEKKFDFIQKKKMKKLVDRWLDNQDTYKELDKCDEGSYETEFYFDEDKYDYKLYIEKVLRKE
jgi:hypothetical protein